MPAVLSPLELGRLRLSVGYGTHKKGRPLSPVEVGLLFRRLRDSGLSLEQCAKTARLDGTGIGRFLRVVELPQNIQHLVDWGSTNGTIGFSCAVELARFRSAEDQNAVADSILENGLDSKEVRQVAQLRIRSQRPVEKCICEVLGMRPTVERRYIFIGSIVDGDVEKKLGELTQRERDSVLMTGIDLLDLRAASGRLGRRFFTLTGGERFNSSMKTIGKDDIETRLRVHVEETLRDVAHRS